MGRVAPAADWWFGVLPKDLIEGRIGPSMNYQRIYYLSLLGLGLIFAIPSIPKLLGSPSLPVILRSIGGAGMALSSAYILVFSDEPAGPTSPNWRFFGVVGGFALCLAGIVISILP